MTLEELRAKIPALRCKEDCGDCCTCHCAMSAMEMRRILEKCHAISPPNFRCGGLEYYEFCMFLGEDMRCQVYDERPIRCRLFGTVADTGSLYRCPHGCAPENPLTDEQVQEILREYETLTAGQDEYHTFGLIDGQIKPITRGDDGRNG